MFSFALAVALAAASPTPPNLATTPPSRSTPSVSRELTEPALRLERLQLDNGLRALLLRDPAAPMIGVFAAVRAGVVHERVGEDGLSHFLEHLLFNGTDTMSQEQLYAAVDSLGGYSNATTRADHTLFQMLVPTANLDDALTLHAAMLFRSTLPAEKFEKERGIVLEEIAKDAADPSHAIESAAARFLFAETPLARPVIGTPETIRAITRERVVAYWRRRYVPANTVVLVVGNANLDTLRASLERIYADIAAATSPPPDATVAVRGDGQIRVEPAVTARIEAQLVWRGPDPVHSDAYALDLVASVLSGEGNFSLRARLKSEGIDANGSASLVRVAGATHFRVDASAAAGTDPRVLARAVNAAVSGSGDVDGGAIADAQRQLTVAAAFLAEKPHYYGIEKSALLANAGAGGIESEPIAIAAATRETLRAVAGRYFRTAPAGFIAGAELDATTFALAASAGMSASVVREAVSRVTRTLPSGMVVSIATNPAARVFAAHLLVRDRAALEPHPYPGAADLLHRLLSLRDPAITSALARAGATLKTTDSASIPYDDYYHVPEWGYLRLETIDTYHEDALDALIGLLGLPFSPAAEAIVEATSAQQAARSRDGSASARSARALAIAMYGKDHPLARSVVGEDGNDATAEALRELAQRYLRPDNLILTIETGLQPDALLTRLGQSPLGRATAAPKAATVKMPAAVAHAETADESVGGTQGYVRIGSALRVAPEDRAAVSLAAAVLSERLAADIREQQGLSYSIGAGVTFRPAPWPDAFTAAAGTRPENVDKVRDAMVRILTELRARGATTEEVQLAAARTGGRAMMRWLSGIGRAYAIGTDLFLGEAPGSGLARTLEARDLDSSSVRDALQRYFDPERLAVVVVR